jgi:hypothetical protein
MSETNISVQSVQLESAKLMTCMLPDDGTDIKLMRQLKNEKGVTRVESIACRGVHHLQQVKTRAGKLPEPTFYRLLSVIVNDEQAEDIFAFIYHNARIGESGRGMLLQTTLLGATAFSIPADVPDEEY